MSREEFQEFRENEGWEEDEEADIPSVNHPAVLLRLFDTKPSLTVQERTNLWVQGYATTFHRCLSHLFELICSNLFFFKRKIFNSLFEDTM